MYHCFCWSRCERQQSYGDVDNDEATESDFLLKSQGTSVAQDVASFHHHFYSVIDHDLINQVSCCTERIQRSSYFTNTGRRF